MAESIKCLTCRYLNNCGFVRKRICGGYEYGMFEEEELEVSPYTDYSDENIIKENERWEP